MRSVCWLQYCIAPDYGSHAKWITSTAVEVHGTLSGPVCTTAVAAADAGKDCLMVLDASSMCASPVDPLGPTSPAVLSELLS